MAILEAEHINKTFGRTEVLKDISFSLNVDSTFLDWFLRKWKDDISALSEFSGDTDKGVIRK